MRAHRSLAGHLAAVYLLLLAYASLYPFEGWRWPGGASSAELLVLQWPPWRNRFDEWANLLGYVPFGAMLYTAVVRSGGSVRSGMVVALGMPALVSYGLELLQHFIPERFPSLRDWVNNVAGAAIGVALAWTAQATGQFERWRRLRERWFLPQSSVAVLLLLMWPLGLLFPSPVPLGLGQIGPEIRGFLLWAVAGTPVEANVDQLLEPASLAPLSLGRETLVVASGLLAPCLLATTVTRSGWRRWTMVPAVLLAAVGAMTLSTAMNFGPDHAMTWATASTGRALLLAAFVGVLLVPAGARASAALALVALTAMVVVVNDAPADPYYAASLQRWEQGRFIRFHGLAQWIGLLWPYAAVAWLVSRVARGARGTR